MKKIILASLLAAVFLMGTENTQAMPTLYPDNFTRNIRNNTNSNYLADSSSPYRFYVLPPNTSFARVKGLHTVTANVGFCAEIAKLQKYNLDTLDLINSMKTKDLSTKAQLDEQNTKLSRANEELSKYIISSGLQELSSLDVRVMQLEKRLDDLYGKYKNCAQDCDVLKKDIEDSQMLRTELATKRFELSAANLAAATEYERKKVYVEGLKSNVDTLQSNWRRIQTDLKDLYVDFNRMFDAHAKREGGRVAINYDSQWSANVDRFRKDNPGYNFEKIQTKNANIKASAYSKNNLIPDGAILSFDVGGQSANGILSFESYPESFSGNAVMSLLGVCPLLHPDWFDIKNINSLENMTYGITVGYEYPVAMKYEVTAHYNMYRMYELIKSQGTSGGFFSSSSWSTQDEQEFFRDSFWVDWKIQDDRQVISDERKMAINADLRRQIMTRLASHLVMNNQAAKLSLASDVPDTGAMVLSNSLSKACPQNIYCKGASIVFDVMQAIFGSSSSEQSIKQIINVDMTDGYSNEQIVMQPIVTTFK